MLKYAACITCFEKFKPQTYEELIMTPYCYLPIYEENRQCIMCCTCGLLCWGKCSRSHDDDHYHQHKFAKVTVCKKDVLNVVNGFIDKPGYERGFTCDGCGAIHTNFESVYHCDDGNIDFCESCKDKAQLTGKKFVHYSGWSLDIIKNMFSGVIDHGMETQKIIDSMEIKDNIVISPESLMTCLDKIASIVLDSDKKKIPSASAKWQS